MGRRGPHGLDLYWNEVSQPQAREPAIERKAAMSVYDERKVLAVDCPKCGAEAGERCRTSRGKRIHDQHTLRKAVVYPSYLKNVRGDTRGKPKL